MKRQGFNLATDKTCERRENSGFLLAFAPMRHLSHPPQRLAQIKPIGSGIERVTPLVTIPLGVLMGEALSAFCVLDFRVSASMYSADICGNKLPPGS